MSEHVFRDARHDGFALDAGGAAGALLLHGFMGTPNEFRPLATALHEAGVSVRVPLLPGFGSQLSSLRETRWQAWVREARAEWDDTCRQFAHVTLIGFSMGGAIATHVAADAPVSRMILLAPFWKMADPRARVLPLAKFVMRDFKPFANASFDHPDLRNGLMLMDPTLNLDDPGTQERIRNEWAIPTTTLVELQRLGKRAAQLAPRVNAETLVLQGTADDTSRPPYTRELVGRLGGRSDLREVAGGHQLVQTAGPSWETVRESVVSFTCANGGC